MYCFKLWFWILPSQIVKAWLCFFLFTSVWCAFEYLWFSFLFKNLLGKKLLEYNSFTMLYQFQVLLLLLFRHAVVSDFLQSHGLRHTRSCCPSPSPEVRPSSCPLHQWCHPGISSCEALFCFCPRSFPASGAFPVSQLFTSCEQNTGVSASVLPLKIQSWFPLQLTGLISLLSKGISWVFSSTTVWRQKFIDVLPSSRSSSHNCMWPLGRLSPWLYRPLSAEWCLCFSTYCLGLSSLSCQKAIVFWFHGSSHHLKGS